MANLKQLADHLGLSQATVSRALNNYATVNARTRQRVLAAAKELNYRPNSSARRLATGRAGAFGLILPTSQNLLSDPHFVDFLSGFTQRLAQDDLDVVLTAAEGEQTYRRIVESRKVDGLALAAPRIGDERIALLNQMGFPYIMHGRSEQPETHGYYDIDNEGAFHDATALLLNLGHRRIALLNGPDDMVFCRDRQAGFDRALSGLGLRSDPRLEFNGPMTEESGYRQVARLMASDDRPTAILCSSMLMALGAGRRLREEGRQIGRDVSLISHDDGLSALKTENFSVPLTVTRAPIRQAGTAIAEMLVRLVTGTNIADLQTVKPVDLVVRASTGAAPRSGD